MADTKKQLKWERLSRTWVPKGDRLFGKIDWDEQHGHVLVIDDVELTMEQFQRTMGVLEGWYFEIKFYDPADIEAPPPPGQM